MSQITCSDFDKICRLCLSREGTLINIFCINIGIGDMISKITSININKGDHLPENICMSCMEKSSEFCKFQQLCENNNVILQTVLSLHKSELSSNDNLCILPDSNIIANQIQPNKRIQIMHHVKDLIPLEKCNKHQSKVSSALVKSSPAGIVVTKDCKIDCDRSHADAVREKLKVNVQNMDIVGSEREHLHSEISDRGIAKLEGEGNDAVSKGEKPFSCSLCHKAFTHKFGLKVHMKSHSAERNYMCTECGKTFIHAHNLKIHTRYHTGEKPYVCNLCFKTFRAQSILSAHKLTHSDEKRFACPICKKRFKRTGDLSVHMRSHTGEKPYACSLCAKRYKMASHLNEHMKTHTGEKNFVCDICPKSFYNKKSLQVHKTTHTDENAYECPECNKCFRHRSSLITHRRKHSNDTNNKDSG